MSLLKLIQDSDSQNGVSAILNAVTQNIEEAIIAVDDSFLHNLEVEALSYEGLKKDQFNQISALKRAGIRTKIFKVNQELGDCHFIQDSLWIAKNLNGDGFVLFVLNPGDPLRKRELPALVEALRGYVDKVVQWNGQGYLEGGDLLLSVLQDDGTAVLTAGLRTDKPKKGNIRSNVEGFESFRKMIEPFGYSLGLFNFENCLHATSGMSMSLDDNGVPVVVSDANHLKKDGIMQLESMGIRVLISDFEDLAWFGVNAPFVGGKRIVSDLDNVVAFYEDNNMTVHQTFSPMYNMAWLQGSGTCLLQLFDYPLITSALRSRVKAEVEA